MYTSIDGVLQHMKPDTFLVDHTSSSPELARRIFEEAKVRQISSIDAPVSGGDIGAREARLVVMCGGEDSALTAIRDVIKCYGANIQLMGGPGAG